MPILAVNVRLPWASGASRGPLSSNTFHFDTAAEAITTANTAAIVGVIQSFYESIGDGLFSSMLDGTIVVSAYDLSDPTPRLPVRVSEGSFTPGADTLPGEATFKVLIKADRQLGVPTQRFRGTLHFGPVQQANIGPDGLIPEAVLDGFETAIDGLQGSIDTDQAFDWVVGTVASGWQKVTTATVTNEFGSIGSRHQTYTDKRVVDVVDT